MITVSVNPANAITWLKVSPVEIPPGKSASVPLTLMVPSNAPSGESYVILTAGGHHFDVRFSVGVPAPAECVAAGYKAPPSTNPAIFWLILLAVIVLVIVSVRNRVKR